MTERTDPAPTTPVRPAPPGRSGDPLPGDEVLPTAGAVMDRRLRFDAPPEAVWPWLEQLGRNRAGWYLPRWVEWVVPARRRAVRRLEARWLGLEVGAVIDDWGPGDPTFELLEVDRPHHLVWWSERPRRPRRGRPRPPLRLTWALVLTGAEGSTARGSELRLRLRLDSGSPPRRVLTPLAIAAGDTVDRLTVWLLGRGLRERLGVLPDRRTRPARSRRPVDPTQER